MGHLVVTAALIKKGEEILIAQRKEGSHLGLKWEFPGGKLNLGESPEAGLIREIKEELDIEIKVIDIFKVVAHSYPDKDVLLLCYACAYLKGEPKPIDCNDFRWVRKEELKSYDLAPADLPIVEKLLGVV